MTGHQQSGAEHYSDVLLALSYTDPTRLADTMLDATRRLIGTNDALHVHSMGSYEAMVVAYDHIVARAVDVAKRLRTEGTSPAAMAEGDLTLRASVAVAGRLAVGMTAREGDVNPPTWSRMLDEIVAREDPGEREGEAGRNGRDVAALVQMNVGLYYRKEPTPVPVFIVLGI